MYAAAAAASANPYGLHTAAGLIPYATSNQTHLTQSTGNPMLDIYNQVRTVFTAHRTRIVAVTFIN